MTTEIDLDAIRQREQAATEGPWRAAWPNGLHPWEVCISADVPLVELAHGEQGIADAEFIAHAREDIPALLAEVDELRAEMDYERRSRFAYEERVSEQVEDLRTEIDRLRTVAAVVERLRAELAFVREEAKSIYDTCKQIERERDELLAALVELAPAKAAE